MSLASRDRYASCADFVEAYIARVRKQGPARITLEPGQSRTVSFTLRPDHLAFYNQRMQRVVEPGFFTVWVGASSADDARPARFEVAGEAQRISP